MDLPKPGEIIHEVGTTRMGSDPKTSVVNEFEQLHDVSNVFVVDAGPFVSQADKNPTWTIMALAWRTSDYIVDQFKKQNFLIMNRRDSLKSLVFGSIGVGVLLEGCVSGVDNETVANSLKKFNYGRTPKEKEYDKLLFSKKCFTNNQMILISKISNLILPPNEFGSINDAEVS